MAELVDAKPGYIGLIRLEEDGSIKQIGLSETQNQMLLAFLSSLSQQSKLILLPPECDLILKSSCKHQKEN